jgi:FkbM family methyltransferase
MTFVDVGANWGYFTLLAAHLVGRNGRVVSVEADPSAARTLEANVVRNRLACVTPIAMAASDEARTVTMRRYEAAGDDSSNFGVAFVAALDAGSGAPALEVPAGTLDAALDRCGVSRVDLLKMDIEGAESRAVAGLGRRLRERLVDRLIIELHPAHLRNQGLSPDDLVDSIRSFGYDAWAIDHSRATHRKAAATSVTAESLLTPLSGRAVLGEWPHLLFARRGLGAFGASEAKAGTRQ